MAEAYVKKKRNTNRKTPKKIMLIAVEGGFANKTEKLYFERFESEHFVLKFVRKSSSDPEGMMRNLEKEYKAPNLSSKNGDIGFSLVDADFNASKNTQLANAGGIASKHEYLHQIVSAPMFEIWYLCHFDFSTRQYNSQEDLISVLKMHISDYSKSKRDVYDVLGDKIELAIKNCKRLHQYNLSSGKKIHTVEFSPYTDVYKLVNMLKSNLDFDN